MKNMWRKWGPRPSDSFQDTMFFLELEPTQTRWKNGHKLTTQQKQRQMGHKQVRVTKRVLVSTLPSAATRLRVGAADNSMRSDTASMLYSTKNPALQPIIFTCSCLTRGSTTLGRYTDDFLLVKHEVTRCQASTLVTSLVHCPSHFQTHTCSVFIPEVLHQMIA